jgi:hypothetical protein
MPSTPGDGATDASIAADGAATDGATMDGAVTAPDAMGPGEDAANPLGDAGLGWDVAPLPVGEAITTPTMETWTWIPFPDAVCGNGEATGIGVNLTNRSTRVMIYMQGGGACWDEGTCYELRTAANLDGYAEPSFNSERGSLSRAAFFNRGDMANPFRDANFVYIPYCTGDVHGGDRVQVYNEAMPMRRTHHVGARNVAAFLRRLMPTFRNPDRIWLSGSSAGGVGASLNWPRIQAAFPMARVDLLNDGGQLVDANNGRARDWRRAWGLPVPGDCPECATSLAANVGWLHRTMGATRRSGLMATLQDATLRGFYTVNPTTFEASTRALLTNQYNGQPNARYFVLAGSMHTFWGGWSTITAPDGTRLRDWITAWATDSSDWRNVGP